MDESGNLPIGELMEPDPVLFTFDAPGWKLLLAILVFILFLYMIFRWQVYRKNKYRRMAIESLQGLNLLQNKSHESLFTIIATLKQVAISSFGRESAASINGTSFMQFLNAKTKKPAFTSQMQAVFNKMLYQGKNLELNPTDLEDFHKQSINWIKEHRV